jgi:hypothetical protein
VHASKKAKNDNSNMNLSNSKTESDSKDAIYSSKQGRQQQKGLEQ